MKKTVFATIATLGLITSGLVTTAQTASATTYTKYTVSPKVRGSWKLKSTFYPIPEHKDPWTIYKRIKISAHSITLTRLTTKVDGTPIEKQMHKREGLSGKYYFVTTNDLSNISRKEFKQVKAYTLKHRYLNAGQLPDGVKTSKSLRKNGLGFSRFYGETYYSTYYAGKMTRQGNELVFKQGNGIVTRYVKE